MGIYPVSSLKTGGLSYIGQSEKKRGPIRLSPSVRLIYGSASPTRNLATMQPGGHKKSPYTNVKLCFISKVLNVSCLL